MLGRQPRRLSLLVVLSVLLFAQLAVPVAATGWEMEDDKATSNRADFTQQVGPNGSNVTGTDSRVGNRTNASSGNETNSSGTASGGGGFGIGIPDPVDMFMDIVGAIADSLIGLGESFIGTFNGFVFSLPAPGTPEDPATWTSPENGAWSGVQGAMGFTTALGIALWTFAVGRAFVESDERSRRTAFVRCGYSGMMILLGVAVTAVTLHLVNGVIQGLAPDAEAFFQTPEDASKLAVGGVVALVLGLVQTATVIGALVVLALERMLVYLTVYLWPLAWAARAYDGFIRSLGETVTYLFGAVVALKLVQALVVRLLFELPLWGAGAGTTLVSMLMTVAGLAFAFIVFPKNMIDHANDAASVSLGMSSARQQGEDYGEKSLERVYDSVHGTYSSYRDGEADRSTGASAPTVGSVGSDGSHSNDTGDPATYQRIGGETPSGGQSVSGGVGGIDANDWVEQRERIDYDRDRGIQ